MQNTITLDIHTHILSEIDDGARYVEDSVEMLEKCIDQGVSAVCLTPHFSAKNDSPDLFLKRRAISIEKLLQAYKSSNISLLAGAEVSYFDGMSNTRQLKLLAISGTNIILVEMPFTEWTSHIIDEVKSIYIKQRLIPLIAHIDRYIYTQKKSYIQELIYDSNILIQVNADFFIDNSTQKTALRMLEKQQFQFFGSDCHNMTSRRPNLYEAVVIIYKKCGEDALHMINTYGEKVLKQAQLIKLRNSPLGENKT